MSGSGESTHGRRLAKPAFLFDLDGTLVDSVYLDEVGVRTGA